MWDQGIRVGDIVTFRHPTKDSWMGKSVIGLEEQSYRQNVSDDERQKERYVVRMKPLLLVTAHTLAERYIHRCHKGIASNGSYYTKNHMVVSCE